MMLNIRLTNTAVKNTYLKTIDYLTRRVEVLEQENKDLKAFIGEFRVVEVELVNERLEGAKRFLGKEKVSELLEGVENNGN